MGPPGPAPEPLWTDVFHFLQAALAQPYQDHVAQYVFLAFRNPLALPANIQREHCPLDVVPHPNPIFRRRQFCHIITLLALIAVGRVAPACLDLPAASKILNPMPEYW